MILIPCVLTQTCMWCDGAFVDARKRKYCPGACAKAAAKAKYNSWSVANRDYSNEKGRRRRALVRLSKQKKIDTTLKSDDQLSTVHQHVCGEGRVDEGMSPMLRVEHETVQHVQEVI